MNSITKRPTSGNPKVGMFDFMIVLTVFFLIIAVLESPTKKHKPAVPTIGYYAVTMNGVVGDGNDIDLYVRDPRGVISFFANPQADLMNLEHDVIPSTTETINGVKGDRCDCERTIIRGILPGEYTVNVQMYMNLTDHPSRAVVSLWSLASGQPLHSQEVTLMTAGDQVTAFRFTLHADGSVCCFNRLPADLVR